LFVIIIWAKDHKLITCRKILFHKWAFLIPNPLSSYTQFTPYSVEEDYTGQLYGGKGCLEAISEFCLIWKEIFNFEDLEDILVIKSWLPFKYQFHFLYMKIYFIVFMSNLISDLSFSEKWLQILPSPNKASGGLSEVTYNVHCMRYFFI
jgi:hypothetical protein